MQTNFGIGVALFGPTKVPCNEACLSVTQYLENSSKDFINFLHNDREQYYKKTDGAQFLEKNPKPKL